MKKYLLILLVLASVGLFAENSVSIITKSDRLKATIELNNSEYITLDHQFLYLTIESDHYNFTFSGYPDGVVKESGEIIYMHSVNLEGALTLKDGVKPGDYKIDVILGFQTTTAEGMRKIPVEISELIEVKEAETLALLPIVGLSLIILSIIAMLIVRRTKRS